MPSVASARVLVEGQPHMGPHQCVLAPRMPFVRLRRRAVPPVQIRQAEGSPILLSARDRPRESCCLLQRYLCGALAESRGRRVRGGQPCVFGPAGEPQVLLLVPARVLGVPLFRRLHPMRPQEPPPPARGVGSAAVRLLRQKKAHQLQIRPPVDLLVGLLRGGQAPEDAREVSPSPVARMIRLRNLPPHGRRHPLPRLLGRPPLGASRRWRRCRGLPGPWPVVATRGVRCARQGLGGPHASWGRFGQNLL